MAEEVKKFLQEHSVVDFYKEGYKQGYQDAINKACKWFEEIDFDGDYFRDGEDYFVNETLIDDFKKAMEE